MIVVTQEGASRLWLQMLGIANLGFPWVHLFANNYAPTHTDTYNTYSAMELVVGGYTPLQLVNPAANWTVAAISAGAQATYVTLTWTFTGACQFYGYWVADASNTYSIWAEAFSTPYVYTATGGPFNLLLQPWLASNPSIGGIPCS